MSTDESDQPDFDRIEEFDEKFSAILQNANSNIQSAVAELMDANHETIQHSRKVIQQLREFANRYADIIDNVILAHAVAAKEISDLYGDMLVGENGLQEVLDDEDEEE